MSTIENQKPPQSEEPGAQSRRQTKRIPLGGLLVAIDAPEIAPEPWVVDATDLSSRGMGLVLPPDLPAGTRVGLSFTLGDGLELSRLPATVLHSRSDHVGAVGFEPWPEAERLKLLEYLVGRYEDLDS